jgi:chemotaxis protein MotB
MKRKSKPQASEGTGAAAQNIWVTTYGDMMTTLMILFMILWAYTQFLHLKIVKPTIPNPAAPEQENELRENIKTELETVGTVVLTRRKITVTLPSAVLFDPGSADLKPEATETLKKVGVALAKSTAPIVVEGHTDDTPIRLSRWRSNYELSAARAFSVIRYFTTALNIPADRLAARGYGPYHPAVPNDSEEFRAKNRRIEIQLWAS